MITEEEKKLPIKDLSARVPYNTWVRMETEGSDKGWNVRLQHDYCLGYISGKITRLYFHEITFKPYLRPMSSMTEEEWKNFRRTLDGGDCEMNDDGETDFIMLWFEPCQLKSAYNCLDYLNSIHIDYRGLIEMGLALEAPEGLYDGRINEIQFLHGEFDNGTNN